MSLVQPPAPERGPSPTLSLSSNNPFRNRAASPSSQQTSPMSPTFNQRPVSQNPFGDVFNVPNVVEPSTRAGGTVTAGSSKTENTAVDEKTLVSMERLNLKDKDKPRIDGPLRAGRRLPEGRRPYPENVPPPTYSSLGPPGGHRPSRSREEAEGKGARNGEGPRLRRAPNHLRPDDALRNGDRRRPSRRSSDSSIRSGKAGHSRERSRSRRDQKGEKSSSSRVRKPNRHLDVIDKLDVTSIYGAGMFHHDGPFDACNPHRNRRKDQRAPMEAFPQNSANNTIGGSGPLNKTFDSSQFMGHKDAEAFTDYSTSGADRPDFDQFGSKSYRPSSAERALAFNATARVDPVHGDESLGLGTSTFLEGAPASRKAIQRRESESDGMRPGGLQRKKSLAQKIRGIGAPRPNGRVISPEPTTGEIGYAMTTSPKAVSAGGPARAERAGNPFFNEYDTAYDKKGASISATQQDEISVVRRDRASSNPKASMPGLERRTTTDNTGQDLNKPLPTSFLSRVKSLKGGKRAAP